MWNYVEKDEFHIITWNYVELNEFHIKCGIMWNGINSTSNVELNKFHIITWNKKCSALTKSFLDEDIGCISLLSILVLRI
jgi:hypothetical protein